MDGWRIRAVFTISLPPAHLARHPGIDPSLLKSSVASVLPGPSSALVCHLRMSSWWHASPSLLPSCPLPNPLPPLRLVDSSALHLARLVILPSAGESTCFSFGKLSLPYSQALSSAD